MRRKRLWRHLEDHAVVFPAGKKGKGRWHWLAAFFIAGASSHYTPITPTSSFTAAADLLPGAAGVRSAKGNRVRPEEQGDVVRTEGVGCAWSGWRDCRKKVSHVTGIRHPTRRRSGGN